MKQPSVIVVGSCVTDLTFYTKNLPKWGQTVIGDFESGLGGKGFNQAVASARSGAETLFLGAIGNDSFGKDFVRFKEDRLSIRLVTLKKEKTGAASISVDKEGSNQIVVALGANKKLSLSNITPYKKYFKNAKVLLLQRETSDELINALIRFARKTNPTIQIILNPAPYDEGYSVVEPVDFLTPNETELEGMSYSKLPYPIDFDGLNRYFSTSSSVWEWQSSTSNLIVTLGKKGCYMHPAEVLVPGIIDIEAIDTSGAGDAFNGALAAGLVLFPYSIHSALKLATRVAGLSVTKKGTSKSIPTFKEIKKYYKRNP